MYIKLFFIFLIFFVPGVYLFILFTTSNELGFGLTFLLSSFGLAYFELNRDKQEIQNFIKKYI